MNTNCSVLLQDIAGISTAVYQTFVPPKSRKLPEERMQEALQEVRKPFVRYELGKKHLIQFFFYVIQYFNRFFYDKIIVIAFAYFPL